MLMRPRIAEAGHALGLEMNVMPCARASALDTGPIKNIVVSSVLIICRAVCWGARSSCFQYRKNQKPWQPSIVFGLVQFRHSF